MVGELHDDEVSARPITVTTDTRAILQQEFDEAAVCFSTKRHTWVDRDLANIPENDADRENAVLIATRSRRKPAVVRNPSS